MNRKRAGRTLFLFLAFEILLAGTIAASPIGKAQQQKKNSEKNLSEVRREIEELEKKKEDVISEIAETDQKLSELLVTIQILEDEIEEKKEIIVQAEKDYQKALKEEEKQYGAMKERIRYIYEKGDISYLDLILKSESLTDAVCQNEYFSRLYEYDRTMFLDYQEIKEQTESLYRLLQEQEAEMEVMEEEYLAEKKELERSVALKRAEAEGFDRQLEEAQKQAKVYAAAVKEQTEKLRQIRAAQSEQLKRQVQAGQRGTTGRPDYNGSNSGGAGGAQSGPGGSSQTQKSYAAYPATRSTGGTAKGREIADYALRFVGNPYVWGGTSLTKGADCSGFVQSVYKHFGVSLPRTSAEQSKFGKKVDFEDLQPGDLVFYAGHVVMSIGDGRIVHASSAKEGIKISDDVTYRTILDIRRPWES